MKKAYFGILCLMANYMNAGQFHLGSSESELRMLHRGDSIISSASNMITFRTVVGSLHVALTYQLREGRSTSLSGTVECDKRKFSSALSDFANLVGAIAADGKIDDTELRLNGLCMAGPTPTDGEQPNYLRVFGKWKQGFVFTASLEGSDKEQLMERSIVTRFGFTISPEVKPSKAPL